MPAPSTAYPYQYERYEIVSYAESVARLMLAEDIGGTDLGDMVNNRYCELEAFYNEVFSILTVVENGAQAVSDVFRRKERLKIFTRFIVMMVTDVFFKACSGHYVIKMW